MWDGRDTLLIVWMLSATVGIVFVLLASLVA
jgi:hypothetical protein